MSPETREKVEAALASAADHLEQDAIVMSLSQLGADRQIKAANDARAALALLREDDGWCYDMERAPRDGTPILALRQWMDAEGLVCVPREATDDMLIAGVESDAVQHPWDALDVYCRMIAAAPTQPGDK
jgi:hypothetical protein